MLKYLAPYVHRVAISNKRIVACDEKTVTYRYTPSGEKKTVMRTVAGTEFVRGFVQHILPPRFQKIRYYGWMSPNSRIDLDEVRWLLWLHRGWVFWLRAGKSAASSTTKPRCNQCGGELTATLITDHHGRVLYTHSLPYLDSG